MPLSSGSPTSGTQCCILYTCQEDNTDSLSSQTGSDDQDLLLKHSTVSDDPSDSLYPYLQE